MISKCGQIATEDHEKSLKRYYNSAITYLLLNFDTAPFEFLMNLFIHGYIVTKAYMIKRGQGVASAGVSSPLFAYTSRRALLYLHHKHRENPLFYWVNHLILTKDPLQ